MNAEQAEILAINALDWLVANEELLPVFMGATGCGADDIKNGAQDPEFLGSVLDFILMDDAWIIAFSDARNLPYEHLRAAREALPGGAAVHWT